MDKFCFQNLLLFQSDQYILESFLHPEEHSIYAFLYTSNNPLEIESNFKVPFAIE